jgi:hypothetical protein
VFAEEVQDSAGTASQIDDTLAGSDTDFFELLVGVRGEIGNLPL